MPRVNLGRDPVKERKEATRRIIRRGMAEQGIQFDKDVADKIGISAPSFSRKMAVGCWTLEELIRLFQMLHLTEQDAAIVLGIKTKQEGRTV